MANSAELHSTYQLGGIVLRVREDLDILVRDYGGQRAYIVEDELTSRYYRIGAAEYTFLSLLDGSTTFATALGRTASIMKQDALTEDRAASFCKWLVQSGLASTEQSRSTERLVEHGEQGAARRKQGRFSAISQRFPLFHPRRSLEVLHRLCGWLFSVPMMVLWSLLVAGGATAVVLQWERFYTGAANVVSSRNWIWLVGTWLILKVLHECGHAVACRRFGGNVREAGILLLMFVPLPYVDVTSAWRFASRWQRILVSSAGMMVELAVAAVAAFVWYHADPGLLSQNALNVIVSAGITTLLFNINPLMRFDGYYILADLLEMPNLYTHGSQEIRQIGRRWILGLPGKSQDYPEGKRPLVLAYGAAAFVWRIAICVGLVLAADALFFGLGSLLAAAAIVTWVLIPLVRLLKFVICGNEFEQPSRLRFFGIVTVVALLVGPGSLLLPWYSTATAPLVVDYYPQLEVRAGVSGFIEEEFVESGQAVKKGELLLTIRNDELNSKLRELELDIQAAKQQSAVYLEEKEIAAFQVEQKTLQALHERLNDLTTQVENLQVKAPHDGIVLSSEVHDNHGAYVTAGSLLLNIGPSDRMEFVALVDQTNVDLFREQSGGNVEVHVNGTGTEWTVTQLMEVAPGATREYPHPAIAAHAGGLLDVRPADVNGQNSESTEARYELLEPHFLVRAKIPMGLQQSLASGQTGQLAFLSHDGSISQHVGHAIGNWWNQRRKALAHVLHQR